MAVINTNITSLIGQQNLNKSQSALSTAMERLSSGSRINSAKDDAAGQAIANRMSSQITGLTQAQRNANDGISVAQTTEGALNQVNDNLQRIRELTVQAQNGTNSADDLESIQNEIGQRLNEINRISDETSFNGLKVMQNDSELKIQVGAKDNQTISINLEQINKNTLGLASFDATQILSSQNLEDVSSDFAVSKTANIAANSYTPSAGATMAADGVYQLNSPQTVSAEVKFNGVATALSDADAVTTGANTAIVSYQDAGTTKYAAVDNASTATKAVALTLNDDGTFTAGSDITASVATINSGTPTAIAEGDTYRSAVVANYAVKGEDGNYYAFAQNPVTGNMTWDSASSPLSESDVDVAGGAVSDVDLTTSNLPSAVTDTGSGLPSGVEFTDTTLYKQNDEANQYITTPGSDTLTNYAMQASDGRYYQVTLAVDTSASGYDSADASTWTMTASVNSDSMVEVSSGNVTSTSEAIVSKESVSSNSDLQNVATNPSDAPTADGVYQLKDGGYAVKGGDNYYAASVGSDGTVSWSSSTTALDENDVDVAGGAVDRVETGETANVNFTGLASGETLHKITDSEGNGTYVVKGGTEENPTYTYATLSNPDVDGNVTVTKETNDDGSLKGATVDPLKMLDNALSKVDSLRSDLGAIQNRFDSAITNLSTTTTNLSAARSRIEDADYAVEVSNMTRAQILQQAGTSVLAQANQVPQGVLSLLG